MLLAPLSTPRDASAVVLAPHSADHLLVRKVLSYFLF